MFESKPGSAEHMRRQMEEHKRQANMDFNDYLKFVYGQFGQSEIKEPAINLLHDDTATLITKDGEEIKFKNE